MLTHNCMFAITTITIITKNLNGKIQKEMQ